MNFFDMSPRAQKIAMALSALGSLAGMGVAQEMDEELSRFPYLPAEQVLRAYVEQNGVLPGLKDNGTGGLVRSDTDVASYIAQRLEESVPQGELFETEQMVPVGICPMPHEWTDEEWLRLTEEMLPTDNVTVAMRKVYHWRNGG